MVITLPIDLDGRLVMDYQIYVTGCISGGGEENSAIIVIMLHQLLKFPCRTKHFLIDVRALIPVVIRDFLSPLSILGFFFFICWISSQ